MTCHGSFETSKWNRMNTLVLSHLYKQYYALQWEKIHIVKDKNSDLRT